MKNGCGVVKVTIVAEFRETDDRGRDVARKGRQHGIELTGSDRYREPDRVLALIGQATEDRLRTAKNRDPLHLACLDTRPNQVERGHRASGQERSLIGGNLHPSMITQPPTKFFFLTPVS